MKTLLSIVAIAAALSLPGAVIAQPHIDNAPVANYTQGGQLRLSGTGFGIKNPVPPVLFDDFEGGADGQEFVSGPSGTGSVPAPWDDWYGYSYDGVRFSYTDSLEVDGRGRCLQVYHPTSANLGYLIKNFTPTGQFYFDADHIMRFPEFDSGVITTQCKPMRVRRQSNQNLSLYSGRTMCDDDGNQSSATGGYGIDNPDAVAECLDDMTNRGWTIPFGWLNWIRWTTWQWVYESGTPGRASSYSKVEFNCEQKNETDTMCDIETGGQDWDQLIVGGQASTLTQAECPGGTEGCYTFWDHVYFDTTWQRIEVGNNPVYANCTTRAIQVPAAWSTTEVVANVHLGSFSPADNLYVFVVDGNNTPSNGFPIRIVEDLGPPGQPAPPSRRL